MQKWVKGSFIKGGKGKNLYEVRGSDNKYVWIEFKDELTAFNGKKRSAFKGKGAFNRDVSSLVFRYLRKQNIANHWVDDVGESEMICSRLDMIPLEVVVRNRLAGSTARKFHLKEGTRIAQPLLELYYKKDELGDPFINLEQAVILGLVSNQSLVELAQNTAKKINNKLCVFFQQAGLELIDFKLEFGCAVDFKNKVVLGDEISCDSCRLWDQNTGNKMDKDRFRLGLGEVSENYQKVCQRLTQQWGGEFAKQ